MTAASPDTPVGPTVLVVKVPGEAPWAFERREDGSVHVAADVVSGGPVREIEISAEAWASVVASVSWAGDTDERYRKAYRFHHGDEPAEQRTAEPGEGPLPEVPPESYGPDSVPLDGGEGR